MSVLENTKQYKCKQVQTLRRAVRQEPSALNPQSNIDHVAGDVETVLGMKYYWLADRFQIEKQEVSILVTGEVYRPAYYYSVWLKYKQMKC